MTDPQPKSEMQKHLKARDVIYKLANHPALPESVFSLLSLMHIDIVQVSKQGYTEPFKGCLDIHYTPANYKLYKKEFDEEFKDYSEEELKNKVLIRADVPYEKVCGEKWKPDHIEYWGELSFVLFTGKDFKLWHSRPNWTFCAGAETGGRTFQDMIIALGRDFFRKFGTFTQEDFLTPAEKENHEKEEIFFTKPCKDKSGCSQLISNPKYKKVWDSEINRRWVKWFATTEFGKKNWGSTLKDVLAGKDIR